MRHPIDKIFEKGLGGQQEYEFTQSEWLDAKAMLDLDKRKRRILFWWFGAVVGILLGAIMVFTFQKNDKISDATINETTIVNPDSESRIAATPNLGDSNTDNTDVGMKEHSIPGVRQNIKNVAHPQSPIRNSKAQRANEKTFNKRTTPKSSKQINPNSPSTDLYTDNKSLTPTVLSQPPALDDASNTVSESKSRIERDLTNDNIVGNIGSSSISQVSVDFILPKIHAFAIEIVVPELTPFNYQEQIVTKKDNKTNLWSLNLYTAYSIPTAKPSVGILLNRKITSKWDASIGLGMAYHKTKSYSNDAEIEIIDINGRTLLSQVSEDLTFKQVTLEIPASLGYRIGRHTVLAIAMAELNLWSELGQEATLNPNNVLDVASPNPISSDPLTITQQSNTFNDPVLSMPRYFVGIGYGFEFNRKLSLHTQGMWNISSSQEGLQSDFLTHQSSTFTDPQWHLRTSVLFRF